MASKVNKRKLFETDLESEDALTKIKSLPNGDHKDSPSEEESSLADSSMDSTSGQAQGSGSGPGRPRRAAAASSEEAAESDTDIPDGEFLVEKVLDYVYEKGVDMYLIKWRGWPHSSNTWEPESNLNCQDKALDYFKLRERDWQNQTKRLKISPSEAREASVKTFEEAHFHPTEQQLVQLLAKYSVNGKLNVKDKLKPLKMVHMEIDQLVRRCGVKASNMKALRKIEKVGEQLLLHRLVERREEQLVALRGWEDDLNNSCSESARLVVENKVDLALPPDNFRYSNDYVPGVGVTIPSDPVIYCACLDCASSKACCAATNNADTAYTRHGKLRLSVGQPIYECNKKCRCGPDCFNRVVQRGRKAKLAIFRTDNGCGWGVKALETIKRGSFVTEYVGEVITNEEAERRGERYDQTGSTYLFDLDFNDQINLYTVDAAVHGNVSHFINHSCEPNLIVYGMFSDCLDPNLPRLALFACQDIPRGEQLFFDYISPLGSNTAAGEINSPVTGVSATPSRLSAGAVPTTPTSSVEPAKTTPSTLEVGRPGEDGRTTPPPRTGGGVSASPTKSPRRLIGRHPSARTTCRCGTKKCRKYLF